MKLQSTLIKNIIVTQKDQPPQESEDEDEGEPVELKEVNLYIREQYVLAHTNNVDIIINNKFNGHRLLKHLKFFKMITKRQMPNMFEEVLYQHDSIRPLVPHKIEIETVEGKPILCSELLFIHAQEDLIEKSLGVDEQIMVMKDCLVAFEDGVQITEADPLIFQVQTNLFVKLKGPGTIYIETTREKTHTFIETFKPKEITQ